MNRGKKEKILHYHFLTISLKAKHVVSSLLDNFTKSYQALLNQMLCILLICQSLCKIFRKWKLIQEKGKGGKWHMKKKKKKKIMQWLIWKLLHKECLKQAMNLEEQREYAPTYLFRRYKPTVAPLRYYIHSFFFFFF